MFRVAREWLAKRPSQSMNPTIASRMTRPQIVADSGAAGTDGEGQGAGLHPDGLVASGTTADVLSIAPAVLDLIGSKCGGLAAARPQGVQITVG